MKVASSAMVTSSPVTLIFLSVCSPARLELDIEDRFPFRLSHDVEFAAHQLGSASDELYLSRAGSLSKR